MTYSEFETFMSVPRLAKYKAACAGDLEMALQLYRANIRLSQQLYAVIGLFEVVLRNALDRHFIQLKGATWLEDAAMPGGYLDAPDCENSFHNVHEAINRLGVEYDHDGLIAALTLGFWINVFGKKLYPASGNTALAIFPHRPPTTNYKQVFALLLKLNILRNRIAHHEPICFDAFGGVSTAMPVKRFALIKDLLAWLGCSHRLLFDQVENVQAHVDAINQLGSRIKLHAELQNCQ